MSTRILQGKKSLRWSHLGLWQISLGPNSPVPGERLQLAILDETGNVVRRLEQIKGRCIDEGYVDFFLGPNCRPAKYLRPLVDIDAEGNVVAELHPDFKQSDGKDLYLEIVEAWAQKWGKPEYEIKA